MDMLRAGGLEREAACRELRDLQVRAALAYLIRQPYPAGAFGADDYEPLAEDFAHESISIILRQLDSFRGESQFTTWAYRIVINLIADEVRLRAWRRRALTDGDDDRARSGASSDPPEAVAERTMVWELIDHVVQRDLTPRQRHVLVGRYFADKPLIVLADELGVDKDAVYKLLHDARKRLKRALLARGPTEADALEAIGGR